MHSEKKVAKRAGMNSSAIATRRADPALAVGITASVLSALFLLYAILCACATHTSCERICRRLRSRELGEARPEPEAEAPAPAACELAGLEA